MSQFVDWLLAAQTPSIRYLTRRKLLHESGDAAAADRAAIMTTGPVPAILARQTAVGSWENEHSYYTPKYISTHWSLMLLTELAVDPADERFQRGVEYMLRTTHNQMQALLQNAGQGFSCFWGNLLRYALHAGRTDDPRVPAIVCYAVHDLTTDFCRCQHNDHYDCAWGVVRTLWGLAALPDRPPAVQAAIDRALPFLLGTFNLVKADYPVPDNGKINPLWFKLNFPLFYQADILFTLRVLAELKALNHPGAAAALDWLEARRAKNCRWRGRSPYRQRTWRELGDSEETNRWVSLQAALVLRAADAVCSG
jgi:hypothetical protein